MIAKRVFWVPKLGNFLKHPGTSENVPELPRTPGELSKNTRNFPKTPGTSPNVPGTFQNTRGTSEHPGNFPKNTRVGGGWWVGGWVPTTPGEGPTGVDRTATWHTWHVSIADWSTSNLSLRGTLRGKKWHVSSPDWSTWHPLPRIKSCQKMPLFGTFGKRFQAYFVPQSVLEYRSVIKIFIRGVSKISKF
jgi:hypothetical protein